MTKEEAIAIIRKEYLCVDRDCDIERNCGKCDLVMPSKEPILEAYKMAIQALEQTQWIPVSERLPEKGKQVLCCNKNGSVFTSAITYINSNGMVAFGQHYEVIAWMPLPKSYLPDINIGNMSENPTGSKPEISSYYGLKSYVRERSEE